VRQVACVRFDDIKKDVKMPEYANWASQDRMPANIEAAYRSDHGKEIARPAFHGA
jgi:hypothetical protein